MRTVNFCARMLLHIKYALDSGQDVWTPALVEVPYEFDFVRPFLTPDLRVNSSGFFSEFLNEVSHKVRKVAKPDF